MAKWPTLVSEDVPLVIAVGSVIDSPRQKWADQISPFDARGIRFLAREIGYSATYGLPNSKRAGCITVFVCSANQIRENPTERAPLLVYHCLST